MSDESPEQKTHAERVGRKNRNRSLRARSVNSTDDWPANLGELLQWYSEEVQAVTRAAQVRLENASKIMSDYRENKTDFDEAAQAVNAHQDKWGDIYPGGVEYRIRGKSSEEINQAIDEYRQRRSAESRSR